LRTWLCLVRWIYYPVDASSPKRFRIFSFTQPHQITKPHSFNNDQTFLIVFAQSLVLFARVQASFRIPNHKSSSRYRLDFNISILFACTYIQTQGSANSPKATLSLPPSTTQRPIFSYRQISFYFLCLFTPKKVCDAHPSRSARPNPVPNFNINFLLVFIPTTIAFTMAIGRGGYNTPAAPMLQKGRGGYNRQGRGGYNRAATTIAQGRGGYNRQQQTAQGRGGYN
jgi:hypothetical protein